MYFVYLNQTIAETIYR